MNADDFLDSLAHWAAPLRLGQIPSQVRAAAMRCIADTIAVGHAGARLDVSARVREWACANYRGGPARLLGWRESLRAPGAALVNATACHALDFDDTCYDGIVHASAVVLPAALAISDANRASGAELLLAYCVGCQVEIEIGRLLTNRLYERGWFNTALLGAIGAAAAAAKALALPPERFRDALALATLEATGIRAVLGSEAKPYLAGRAAESGVRAALHACEGLVVPARVLDDATGFINTHLGEEPADGGMQPGERWAFADPGFALKLFPVCSAAQAAAEELQLLRKERSLRAEDVRRISVAGTSLVVRSLRYHQPGTFQEAQFSMPFALACILRFGELGPEQLAGAIVTDPQVRASMASVSLCEAAELESRVENGAACPEPAHLQIELATGERVERTRLASSGMPQRPFSAAQARAKFDVCARYAGLEPAKADRLFDGLGRLEQIESLEALHPEP